MLHRRFALLPIAALLSLPAAAQAVWTVDLDGSGGFTEIQPAVDAAADGDVILVAPGAYPPFHVQGKGVRIHGFGSTIFNQPVGGVAGPAVVISDVPAASAVVLEGLSVFSALTGFDSVVHLRDCAGPVWMHGAFVDAYGATSLHVERCDSVVLDQALLQTNAGGAAPGHGARVEGGSRLFAHGTQFQGSHFEFTEPGDPPPTGPQDGGHGLLLVDSEAHLTGGGAFGGGGSAFLSGGCWLGGEGGDGIVLQGAGGALPELRMVGVTLGGGYAGAAFVANPCLPLASAGVALDPGPGVVVDVDVEPRRFSYDLGAVEPGDALTVIAEGQPGDLVALFASAGPMPALSFADAPPLWLLHLHVAPSPLVPLLVQPLAAHAVGFELTIPPLPPGMLAFTPALQGVIVPPAGIPQSGAPLALAIH